MKKNIPTTISGTLFYIEEDAYERLSQYLGSIKTHFASYADNAEIISDIESRIAERFLENKHKDNVVTLSDVEALIKSMGNVEDFDEGEDKTTPLAKGETIKKKLFRNPDDVIIGGVASGLAAYLGLDPLIVRIIFILVVFFGGSGVLIYIILWLIMPEAKTPTEKLQMRGERVTLESVTDAVKEKIDEAKEHKGTFRKIISLPFVILGKIFRTILPFIGKLFGILFSIAGSAAILGLFFLLTTILFNVNSPYIDFPLMQIGNNVLVYIGIFAAFFVAIVPVIFFVLLGITIVRNKNMFNKAAALSLLGAWAISLITVGAVSTRLIPEYRNFMETSPLYAETEVELMYKDFTNLSVREGNRVHVALGDKFKVTAKGAEINLQKLHLSVLDGTLNIERGENSKICIFCVHRAPEIYIVMPKLNEITAENGARIDSENIKAENLSVKLLNGSRAKLLLDVKNLTIKEENASRVTVSGKAETLLLTLENASKFDAEELVVKNATIQAKNGSVAEVGTITTLKVDLQNGSLVIYEGTPVIDKNIRNGSRLEKRDF